jgi:hypothetical protein
MTEASAPTWPRRPQALVQELEQLWRQGEQPDPHAFLAANGPHSSAEMAVVLACDQWQRWHRARACRWKNTCAVVPTWQRMPTRRSN